MTVVAFADLIAACTANGKSAQACARLGWPVVPWQHDLDGKKVPTGKWRHNGAKLMLDQDDIYDHWCWQPYSLAGFMTGPEAGIAILDVDPRNGGDESLERLQSDHEPLPVTFTVRTPSGGKHLYFAYPTDRRHIKTAPLDKDRYPGLDVKGWGGFVGAPGCVTERGTYEVAVDGVQTADMPGWLVDIAERRSGASTGVADVDRGRSSGPPSARDDWWAKDAADVPAGGQEDHLFRGLCSMRARNVDPDKMIEVGWQAAQGFTQTKPTPWTLADVEAKVRHVVASYPAGLSDELDRPHGRQPIRTAENLVIERTYPPGVPNLVASDVIELFERAKVRVVRWRNTWLVYRSDTRGRYVRVSDDDDKTFMPDQVRHALRNATFLDDDQAVSWNPTIARISEVVAAIETFTRLPSDTESHTWLDPRFGEMCPPGELIVCRNGILHVPRTGPRKMLDGGHTPEFFTEVALDIDHDPNADTPDRWLRFLGELWPNDPDSVKTLQEWFGYVLSGATILQKILMLVGPRRAGKGTIVWVLEQLLGGRREIARPTLKSLGGAFGLAPLLGKRLAVVGDARGGDRDAEALIEKLLTISGEDPVDVNRKFKPEITVQLGVRFMILSNEDLLLRDASGAMPSRFVPLRLTQSWLGKEDLKLKDELKNELSGILNWSLDGLDRLRRNGAFTISNASRLMMDNLEDDASPVRQFVERHCVIGHDRDVPKDKLFSEWTTWAGAGGYSPGSSATFGRDLRAACPGVSSGKRGPKGEQTPVYVGIDLAPKRTPAVSGEVSV